MLDGKLEEARGDINKLTHDQKELLFEKVIPTAEKWLSIPALAEHGRKTLDYWGAQHD